RARSKGARSLDAALVALLERARAERHALDAAAWIDAIAKGGAEATGAPKTVDEARAFDDAIVKGTEPALPDGALGPCFRSGNGEYVAFDLGFDDRATSESAARAVVGLKANGPAAKAGLREGDGIEEAAYRDGHAEVPVKLTITRGGAKTTITYDPRGERRRGQTWARVAGMSDERCGTVL